MRIHSQHLAQFTFFILILAGTSAEACFAREVNLANVSISNQNFPCPEPIVANNHGENLDLESLEQRFRKSTSLGLLDKINIQSEVDGLILLVSDFHHAKNNETIKTLRVRFENLLSRVYELLKNDSELRQDIASSREDLWKILLDPVRIAKR